MKGWANTTPNKNKKKPRLDEQLQYVELPPNKWIQVRFVGPVISCGVVWPEIKKNDGGTVKFPLYSPTWDSQAEQASDKDPYAKIGLEYRPEYLSNIIVRELQENKPRKLRPHTKKEKKLRKMDGYKCYIKEQGSKSWSPVRAVRVTPSLAGKLQDIVALINRKNKGEKRDLFDPKYGIDVSIKYNPKAAGSDKYQVSKEERTPLTEEEKKYLLQDLEGALAKVVESVEEAKRNAKFLKPKLITEDEDEEEEEDGEEEDDYYDSKKKKGKKGKSGKKRRDDDDEDDDDLEDLDDEEDEDNEDDDDEPKKKKSKKSKSKKSKKSRDDDEEDDDDLEDLEDLDEDEEEDNDDDEEDEEEDDDEDDEPRRKKSKKVKKSKKAKKSTKKKRRDDDDDDDDDDD